MNNNQIKGKILHKLLRAGKIEASHTAIENLHKGFPKDMAGEVKDNVKELIKEGILLEKHTSYGVQISINIAYSEKIKEYIRIFLTE
ncbi:MAG: hypothetical protein PHO02_01585 [Candidatus Nanoarchaeia archaeon]|nr:hypothetical protein [Candidatus Nanoarchaeia archaeon]